VKTYLPLRLLALYFPVFMKETFFISFFILLCHDIRAQISGIVVDIETRIPVKDVTINMNTNKGVRTKWDGSFHRRLQQCHVHAFGLSVAQHEA